MATKKELQAKRDKRKTVRGKKVGKGKSSTAKSKSTGRSGVGTLGSGGAASAVKKLNQRQIDIKNI